MIAETIFWLLIALIIYVYCGYPLVLIFLSKLRPAPMVKRADITPTVSLIIPAYNEEKVIRDKIENSLSLDYPEDNVEIIVASDASTDKTNDIVKDYANNGVKLIVESRRCGKTAMLNKVIPLAKGEIIVFTDANALFAKNAISKLVRNFADLSIGGVGGSMCFVNLEESCVARSEGLFVRYERVLRQAASNLGIMAFTIGAIYAIRKHLFRPIDNDLADDFAIPLEIILQGYRMLQDNDAQAYERTSVSGIEEFRRKARIVARDSRAYIRYRGMISSKTFKITVELFSHKFLRWSVPFMLIGTLITNFYLLFHGESWFYVTALSSQAIFYSLACIGLVFNDKIKLPFYISLPYFFVLINVAALVGLLFNLSGQQTATWHRAETTRYLIS